MSNWTDVNRLRLIEAFRKRPCLWCKSHPDYAHPDIRKKALTEITNYMNQLEMDHNSFSEDDIRTQFKNLKDMYQRKVKKMRLLKNDVQQKVEEPCWFYFQHLKFLGTIYQPYNNASRSPSPLTVVKTEIPSAIDDQEPLPQQTSKRRKGPLPPSIPKRTRSSYITETAPSPPSPSPAPPNRRNDDSDDELTVFGQFVARSIRKLSSSSPALAIQVKKQINDLLCEAELNELRYQKSSST